MKMKHIKNLNGIVSHYHLKRKPRILFFFVFLFIIEVAFFFRLLSDFNGYISYGNFPTSFMYNLTPFTNIFWNISGGFPLYDPFVNLLNIFILNGPLFLFGTLIGTDWGVKLYITGSVFLLGFSFYYLLSVLNINGWGREIGTLFLLFNPFQLQLYGSGDFSIFIDLSFLFLSLAFLYKGLNKGSFFNKYFYIFLVFLLFTILYIEIFYFGVFISIIFALIVIVYSYRKDGISTILKKFVSFIISFAFIVPMSLIYFLPLFASGIYVSSTSPIVLSVDLFRTYSESIFNLMILKGYQPNLGWMSSATFGKIYFQTWQLLELALVIFILLQSILLKGIKYKVILSLLLIAFLLGSGLNSPLANLNLILYQKFPGYPVLNTSYWWEWVIVSPLYSAIVAFSLDDLSKNPLKKIISLPSLSKKTQVNIVVSKKNKGIDHPFFIFFVVLIVIILLMPIVTQGYYGGYDGIREKNLPKDYFIEPYVVQSLVGNNYTGIAYITPSNYVIYNNGSQYFGNVLMESNSFYRTPIISFNGVSSLNETNFYYWVFKLFYENRTKFFPELMAMAGISYFVTLNNLSSIYYGSYFMPWSWHVNPNSLMSYQTGVKKIYSSNSYSIYKNDYYNGEAVYVNSFTLVSGSFNILNRMAYAGFNLSNLNILFANEANGFNATSLLANTTLIVSSSVNELNSLGLALDEKAKQISLNRYTNNIYSNVSLSWVNSYEMTQSPGSMLINRTLQYGYIPYITSQPSPSLITYGRHLLTIPVSINSSGLHSIWMHVLFSSSGNSSLEVLLNGQVIKSLITSAEYNGSKGYQWVRVVANMTSGLNNISFLSTDGLNSINSLYITRFGSESATMKEILDVTRHEHIPIYLISSISDNNITLLGYFKYNYNKGNTLSEGDYFKISNPKIPSIYKTNCANVNISIVDTNNSLYSGIGYFQVPSFVKTTYLELYSFSNSSNTEIYNEDNSTTTNIINGKPTWISIPENRPASGSYVRFDILTGSVGPLKIVVSSLASPLCSNSSLFSLAGLKNYSNLIPHNSIKVVPTIYGYNIFASGKLDILLRNPFYNSFLVGSGKLKTHSVLDGVDTLFVPTSSYKNVSVISFSVKQFTYGIISFVISTFIFLFALMIQYLRSNKEIHL